MDFHCFHRRLLGVPQTFAARLRSAQHTDSIGFINILIVILLSI